MAASASAAELPDVRELASRLFLQCRDSPSSYKRLAASVKKLRNALEEIEDDWDATRTLGPGDLKLLEQIARSQQLLGGLDAALQSLRSESHKDVNLEAVEDMKTDLDDLTQVISTAFESTAAGDIPAQYDANQSQNATVIHHPSTSASIQSSSNGPTSPASRQSSMWSLPHRDDLRSPGASDATSVHNERSDRFASEEKQVASQAMTSATMDFRSPFAIVDPMSVSFDDATSWLMSGDDDMSMSATARPSRSRPHSGHSATTERLVSAYSRTTAGSDHRPRSTDISGEAPPAYVPPAAGSPNSPYPNDKGLYHGQQSPQTRTTARSPSISKPAGIDPNVRQHPAFTRAQHSATFSIIDSELERSVETIKPTEEHTSIDLLQTKNATKDEPTEQPTTSRSSGVSLEEERQSLSSATRDLALQRAQSNASSPLSRLVDDSNKRRSDSSLSRRTSNFPKWRTTTRSNESYDATHRVSSGSISPVLPSPRKAAGNSGNNSEHSSLSEELSKDINEILESALEGGKPNEAARPLSLGSIAGQDELSRPSTSEEQAPPLPLRRPPPPPPPKRSRTNGQLKLASSKYRIANADIVESSDEESDQERYSTPLPASPVEARSEAQPCSPLPLTPTITLDQSALDDVDKPAVRVVEEPRSVEEVTEEVSQPATQSFKVPQGTNTPPIFAKPSVFAKTTRKPWSPPPTITPPESREEKGLPSVPLPASARRRVDAAVKAGDKLLAKRIEASFEQPERKPPPVPPRPKSSLGRPRASTSTSSPAAAITDTGITASPMTEPSERRLLPRISISQATQALNGATYRSPASPALGSLPIDNVRHSRSASTSQLPPPKNLSRSPSRDRRISGWYGAGVDDTSDADLDQERVEQIVQFWNAMDWESAEPYLKGYLESLIKQDHMVVARRVRHLLGVCASYRGDYRGAIDLFLSVFDVPIREVADLTKPGYCEACYWLGDNYAMLNQRTEALLAYCAAEEGNVFSDLEEHFLLDLIRLEQDAVRLGVSKSDYRLRWWSEMKEGSGTFLDPNVISATVVEYLLGDANLLRRKSSEGSAKKLFYLDPNHPRCKALSALSKTPQTANFRQLTIRAKDFSAETSWPMAFDPMFAMSNVKRERLLASESDLLALMESGSLETKLPKSGPVSLSRMECFTCGSLAWLITSLRSCLRINGMDWSEVVNEQGVWLIARHSFKAPPSASPDSKITTTHYFAISLFKQSFPARYGVEICSHGVSSARILSQTDMDHDKGVHSSEPKRIKKLVREYLEEAAKNRPKTKKKDSLVGLGISQDAQAVGGSVKKKANTYHSVFA